MEVEEEEEVFIHSFTMYLSTRFYENEPNEICSNLSEKGSKSRFIAPDQFQNHTSQGKERGKRNSEEHYFRLTEEVHFKTPARYIFLIFSQTNSVVLTLFTTLFISTGSPFYCRIYKDDSVDKRLYPFCLFYFSFSCGNIQMFIPCYIKGDTTKKKAMHDSRKKSLYF